MQTIGITGAYGFLGWHLRTRLLREDQFRVKAIGREQFLDNAALRHFAGTCNAIVHLAGMNRGDDSELEHVNKALARRLVEACTTSGASPHVILANSTHVSRDTAYGRSKRACAEMFRAWSAQTGASFTNLILPNVFGESCKPFYNSVVATFCHELANKQPLRIIHDAELEFVHAQRVADIMVSIMRSVTTGDVHVDGTPLRVSNLLTDLERMFAAHRRHEIPGMRNTVELELFNTLQSYLFPDHYPRALKNFAGAIDRIDAIPSETRADDDCSEVRLGSGQSFGDCYHTRRVRRLIMQQGNAQVTVDKLLTAGTNSFQLTGEMLHYLDIPIMHTYRISNSGSTRVIATIRALGSSDCGGADTFTVPQKD